MPTAPSETEGLPLSALPLRDAQGSQIPFRSRVEQVAVNEKHGALGSRLHQQGEVIGRDRRRVYVRFDDDQQLVALPPIWCACSPKPRVVPAAS